MTDLQITPEVQNLIADIAAPLTDAEIANEVVEMQKLFDKFQPRKLLNNQPAIEKARTKILEAGGTLICEKRVWIYQASPDAPEVCMSGREFAEFRTTL